jgi:hypothetical protein
VRSKLMQKVDYNKPPAPRRPGEHVSACRRKGAFQTGTRRSKRMDTNTDTPYVGMRSLAASQPKKQRSAEHQIDNVRQPDQKFWMQVRLMFHVVRYHDDNEI